jgi:hypothetical protein
VEFLLVGCRLTFWSEAGNEVEGKSKDLTQRTRREGGEKSEKDKNAYRRDAEGAEKTTRGLD